MKKTEYDFQSLSKYFPSKIHKIDFVKENKHYIVTLDLIEFSLGPDLFYSIIVRADNFKIDKIEIKEVGFKDGSIWFCFSDFDLIASYSSAYENINIREIGEAWNFLA